jgi:hypothetical protein
MNKFLFQIWLGFKARRKDYPQNKFRAPGAETVGNLVTLSAWVYYASNSGITLFEGRISGKF